MGDRALEFARGSGFVHRLSGHYWTLRAHLGANAWRLGRPPSVPWRSELADPLLGRVPLSGRWCRGPDVERALILVHGLGGNADSAYLDALQAAAHAQGVSTLRLSLRGADLRGPDLYHAGLWQDIAAAATSPELARYPRLLLAGYSLGGHVALSYALRARDPRLAALVAVCPPLDLALSAQAFDRCAGIYRKHVMAGLKAMFRAVTRAQSAGPWRDLRYRDVARITSVVEWDERVIAPRHGFQGAHDYYARTSVGPALGDLPCRTLIISSSKTRWCRSPRSRRCCARI
jgi:uncharacterized protein